MKTAGVVSRSYIETKFFECVFRRFGIPKLSHRAGSSQPLFPEHCGHRFLASRTILDFSPSESAAESRHNLIAWASLRNRLLTVPERSLIFLYVSSSPHNFTNRSYPGMGRYIERWSGYDFPPRGIPKETFIDSCLKRSLIFSADSGDQWLA